MNSKRANIGFLLLVFTHYLLMVVILTTDLYEHLDIVSNIVVSELMVLIPISIAAISSKEKLLDILGFHKIKISTIFMIVLFTFLTLPLSTLINSISMLFVDNTMAEVSGDILDVPFILIYGIMALFGPLCEEISFRGIIFHGYQKSGNRVKAILLSSLLFGLMHMNYNQAAYAFVVGIMMALLVEATGSIWSSFIFHMIFNGNSVLLLFISKAIYKNDFVTQLEQTALTKEQLLVTICIYTVIATVTTGIAVCVLQWIGKNEGREHFLKEIWESRKSCKENTVSIPLIIGIVLSLFYMTFLVIAS